MILFERKKDGNKRTLTLFGVTFSYIKKAKMPPHIQKEVILPQIDTLNESGVSAEKRSQKLIVSLTSFPERTPEIHFTIYSLLTQDLKPDEVILWLAKEQYPNGLDDLPEILLNLQQWGLSIKWCEDLRSYKKLLPTLQEYPDDVIVIVDDDVFYPRDFLKKLYHEHLKDPKTVIGHRLHRITLDKEGKPLPYKEWRKNTTQTKPSYRNFLTGCGGILYPPHVLYKDIDNVSLIRELAPYADDIWFWAMSVLNNTKIKTFSGRYRKVLLVNPEREMRQTDELTLTKINIANGGNDKQMAAILKHYPEILAKLKEV